MRVSDASSDTADRPWPAAITETVGMTERGLTLGEGTTLAKIDLAGALDTDRIVAMLSVAAGRPLRPPPMPPIEEAVALWRRGEKALANLRLAFAGLPRLTDPAMAQRLAMAEQVLDHGLSPAALMKELWPDPRADALGKYNPDQPRVPAGSGRESGEWTFGDASAAGGTIRYREGRIVVAQEDEPPPSKELSYQEQQIERTGAYGKAPVLVSPLTEMPGGAFAETAKLLLENAREAVEAVGPGRGPVYGTAVHTEFKKRVDALGRSDLLTEKSYRGGFPISRGARGSVRLDTIIGTEAEPLAIVDVKTGKSPLTASRATELRDNAPNEAALPIFEVRP